MGEPRDAAVNFDTYQQLLQIFAQTSYFQKLMVSEVQICTNMEGACFPSGKNTDGLIGMAASGWISLHEIWKIHKIQKK